MRVASYAGLAGDDFEIIGRYESGIDAAFNLARAGKRSTVLAGRPCWRAKTVDPSSELAPYTAARLMKDPRFEGTRPRLMAPYVVTRVESRTDGAGFDSIPGEGGNGRNAVPSHSSGCF